ncbi:hypothetical protein PEBR_09355 [Penicillium brasilianum]|uniref:Histidine-specific methyltransferase SAM-dependent domain-containing protein n=1 Tax=Penicillium brasilianum TaxID=104259 RepID=A0A1S9S3F5_PENBI|nr:hypothetical protein PEBR_09355 [Penicillium brasilianum]
MGSIASEYPTVDGIIDIRQSNGHHDMKSAILESLSKNPRELPSVLIWDIKGLEIYDKLCQESAYYPRSCEIEILQRHCSDMAKTFPPSSILIELGCGNLQKTGAILGALQAQKKEVFYYALDMSMESLRQGLRELSAGFSSSSAVHFAGLLGTYADCLRWFESIFDSVLTDNITFLWMGNSIANAEIEDARKMLKSFRQACRGRCSFIFGADACSDASRVLATYNDKPGHFRSLVGNGMRGANLALGREVFSLEDWEIRVWFDQQSNMIRCSHVSKRDLSLDIAGHPFFFSQGTEIKQLLSGKWSYDQILSMSQRAGFKVTDFWMSSESIYGFYRINSHNLRIM